MRGPRSQARASRAPRPGGDTTRPSVAPEGDERSEVSERERKVLGIIETARGKQAKFRDAQITMAHGAGGKATQGLIEGLLVPALGSGSGSLEALADAGAVEVAGSRLAMTTDSFVVKPLPPPSAGTSFAGRSTAKCSALATRSATTTGGHD